MTGLIFIEPILGIYQQIEIKLDGDNELSNQLSRVYLLRDHTVKISSWALRGASLKMIENTNNILPMICCDRHHQLSTPLPRWRVVGCMRSIC